MALLRRHCWARQRGWEVVEVCASVFIVKAAARTNANTCVGRNSCVLSSVCIGTSVCNQRKQRPLKTRRDCTFLRGDGPASARLPASRIEASCHAPSTCLREPAAHTCTSTHLHTYTRLTGFYSRLFPDAAGRRPSAKSSSSSPTACPIFASPLPTHLPNHCRRIQQHRPWQQGLRWRRPENRVAHAGALV